MVDVSIICPYAADWPPIYFTLNQLATVLVHSKLTHEIIVVANNSDEAAIVGAAKLITACDFAGAHKSRMIVEDNPSNGNAANIGAKKATGKYLCFTDSHVVVHPNIFTECIKVMEQDEKAGLIHAPVTWTGLPYKPDFSFDNTKRCYQYKYGEWDAKRPGEWYIKQHFHGTYNHKLVSEQPYQIAGCGHGWFMIRRDTWEKIGGYHPAQKAYGGREAFVTFKAWLFGFHNYTVPTTNHIHYNGARLYHWNMDWWYKNAMMQAYSTAGEKWLDIIYDKFKAKPRVRPHVIARLREEAVAESKEQRAFVEANQQMAFDDLFPMWTSNGVFW